MRRLRWVVLSSLACLLLVVMGGCFFLNSPDPDPSDTQSFSGTGQQVTPLFRLTEGSAIFRMTHTGSSNFIIWLEDDTANMVALLVNKIGSFSGSASEHIEDTGWFMLDISADGAWTVTIEQ
jgi:hypothetical protein